MCRSFVSRIALYELLIVLLCLAFLPFSQAIAQKPPAGVFIPRPGEYLVTEGNPQVFDLVLADGITIEIWFFLAGEADVPEDWVLFGKDGSYWTELKSTGDSWEVKVDVYTQFKNAIGHVRGAFESEELNRWLHVALQIRGGTSWGSYHGNLMFLTAARNVWKLARSQSPLIIGWRKNPDKSSQEMWIDQVRISKITRYTRSTRFRGDPPSRPLPVDEHTFVLWNFDEGPGARRYAEATGKIYTLNRRTPLAVDGKGNLTTVWGEMKKSE